jgi:hypothetical protein
MTTPTTAEVGHGSDGTLKLMGGDDDRSAAEPGNPKAV